MREPGPRSREIVERERRHAAAGMQGFALYAGLAMARGQGCTLVDEDGQEYIDFIAGIAVGSVGHCHPHYVEALKRQVEKLHFGSFTTEARARFLELVASVMPEGLTRIQMFSGGAEAVGFASWREGLVVRPGAQVRGLDDVARQGLRLVNREPGAQARTLLDRERLRLGLGEDAHPDRVPRLGQGKLEGGNAAAAGPAERKPAAVGTRDLRDDLGPVPPTRIAASGVRARPAAVCDRDPDTTRHASARHHHRWAAVLERVCDQVVERLSHPPGVAFDRRRAGIPVEADPARVGRRQAPVLEAGEHDLAAVEPIPRAAQLAAVERPIQVPEGALGHLQQTAATGPGRCRHGLAGALLQEDECLQRAAQLMQGAVERSLVGWGDHPPRSL